MTAITDARTIIQAEETRTRAPTSESMFTRVGGAINFINNRQLFVFNFNINGGYDLAAGQAGLEGLFMFPFDFEIHSIGISNMVPGSGGTTTLDVHLLTASGVDAGTIFSTKPSVDSTSPSNAYALRQYLPGVSDIKTSTGITLPSLTTTSFDAGDAFRVDVDSVMTAAENVALQIMYRPR